MNNDAKLGRRDFLKMLGVGAGAVAVGPSGLAAPKPPAGTMPLRVYGRSGMKVSILSMGGMFDIPNNQIVLHQALASGVTHWDTADCYEGGKSEAGIGQFFERVPDARKKIFLVTKSDARDPDGMTRLLDRSLERMKTDSVDLYVLHHMDTPNDLNPDVKAWAAKAKKSGKIKLFGFSTHKNMYACMYAGAEAGWIDGIMMKYDFRLRRNDEMKRAVAACVKAGIGLTAMKTMAGGPVRTGTEAELELAGKFIQRGFTEHQAKLKAVWEDPDIATICSQMPNVTILKANVAAALDQTPLTLKEHEALDQYAAATSSSYCAGCSARCETVSGLPVCDVMRHMMYLHAYDNRELARVSFAGLPESVRQVMARPDLDLSSAEQACPHRLPLARLMREAIQQLG